MPASMLDAAAARERMVRTHLEARGIRDPALLEAFREVPREAFVPPELEEFAYEDAPLPIECEQTISQPYIVALMATAPAGMRSQLSALSSHTGLASAILSCWRDPRSRGVGSWVSHEDINDVMLASGLVPEGVLVLHPPETP